MTLGSFRQGTPHKYSVLIAIFFPWGISLKALLSLRRITSESKLICGDVQTVMLLVAILPTFAYLILDLAIR